MLNIGLWELLVIVVAGLVFVGPERLPNVMRFLGRSYAKVRHASRDLRMAFQQEVDRVDNELRTLMHNAAERVTNQAKHFGCSLHTAAHIAALGHVAQLYQYRGIFP